MRSPRPVISVVSASVLPESDARTEAVRKRRAAQLVLQFALQLLRIVSLVMLAGLGTVVLMRVAPGYFTDTREIDGRFADMAQSELALRQQAEGSVLHLCATVLGRWAHGDLGRSLQYDVPARELIASRLPTTARLLATSVVSGWLLALTLALPLAARRGSAGEPVISGSTALLLAIPTGALAVLCLTLDRGGPAIVLAAVIAVRDFKLLYRLLRVAWSDPCLLHARACGLTTRRITLVHLLPRTLRESVALASMSFVLALSAVVPVEVLFNTPGIGQLAWSAVMNRDLPVLLAISLAMAVAVGAASLLGRALATPQTA